MKAVDNGTGRESVCVLCSTENGSMSNREVGAYSVFGVNFNYNITKNLRANAGINNLLDKQLYREADGASTYNEPGRAYYAGLTMTF